MLSPLVLLPGLRLHLRNKFRFFLILFGIILGTALCTFIVVVNEATMTSLGKSVQDLVGDTDLIISATGGESFPAATLDEVLKVPGVAVAAPVIQKKVFVLLPGGKQKSLTLLGIDLLNDSSVRGKSENGEEPSRMIADPLAFMASPKSVAVTNAFAAKSGIKLGDSLSLVTATGKMKFEVRALIPDRGAGKSFDGAIAVMDIEAARLAFGKADKTDLINVSLEKKSELASVLKTLSAKLGESYNIEPPSSQLESLREVVAPFRALSVFLGALAVIMSIALVFNSAKLSINERRIEIATLRALGASRRTILLTLTSEYFLLGALGSVIGSGSALVLANLFTTLIQQGVRAQTQSDFSLSASAIDPVIAIGVAALGTLLTVAAVLIPILSVTRVSPAEVFSESQDVTPINARPSLMRRASLIIGILLLAPLLPMHDPRSAILELCPLIGGILLGAPLAVFILKQSRRLAHAFQSPLIELSWNYAASNPKRVESSLRGLVLGLFLIFILSSVQNGFTSALAKMFIRTARPDFYVSSIGDFLSPMTLQPLDESLQTEIAKVSGVDGVFGQRIIPLKFAGHAIKMSAFDEVPAKLLQTPYSYFDVTDRPLEDAGHDLYHGDAHAIFVSESFKSLFNKKSGDEVELGVLDHSEKFKIVGVVRDFTAGGGRIYMSRDRYKALWHDSLVTGIAIVVAKGFTLPDVRKAVDEKFGADRGLMTTVDRSIKGDVEKILQRSFVTFDLVEYVCILVAGLGFLSSFFISVQSRRGELAAMRATGCSKVQLSFIVAVEAVLVGCSASLATLILAPLIAWRLISRSMPAMMGWVISYQFNFGIYILIFILGAVLTGIASLYAIRWARNFNLATALQGD